MPKKILIFSVVWPPAHSPGARRMVAFARYFTSVGYEVHVVTSAVQDSLYGDGPSLAKVDGVTLHLINDPIPKGAIRRSLGNQSRFKKLVAKIRDRLGLDKDLPIGIAMFWYFLAHRKEMKADWVVGSFPNIVNILIAAVASRLSGASLLADFRDAWTKDSDYRWNLFTPLSSAFERHVLKRAEILTFVSRGVMEQLSGSQCREKRSILVRNGADALNPIPYQPEGECVFGYWGSFRGANRDCRPLFRAISLANLEASRPIYLEIYTGDDLEELQRVALECDCQEFLRVHPPVEMEQLPSRASRWISGIVVTRTDFRARGELTTKLFDYAGGCLPVVAIAPLGFEIREVVSNMPHARVFRPTDVDAMAEYFRSTVGRRLEPDVAEEFTRARIIERALGAEFTR